MGGGRFPHQQPLSIGYVFFIKKKNKKTVIVADDNNSVFNISYGSLTIRLCICILRKKKKIIKKTNKLVGLNYRPVIETLKLILDEHPYFPMTSMKQLF